MGPPERSRMENKPAPSRTGPEEKCRGKDTVRPTAFVNRNTSPALEKPEDGWETARSRQRSDFCSAIRGLVRFVNSRPPEVGSEGVRVRNRQWVYCSIGTP